MRRLGIPLNPFSRLLWGGAEGGVCWSSITNSSCSTLLLHRGDDRRRLCFTNVSLFSAPAQTRAKFLLFFKFCRTIRRRLGFDELWNRDSVSVQRLCVGARPQTFKGNRLVHDNMTLDTFMRVTRLFLVTFCRPVCTNPPVFVRGRRRYTET